MNTDDDLGRLLAAELERTGAGIEVPEGWDAIAARLEPRRVRAPRRRAIVVAVAVAVAAAAIVVAWTGGPLRTQPAPGPIATPSAIQPSPVVVVGPHLGTTPPLVIDRIGVTPLDDAEEPGRPFLTPERVDRPGVSDRARTALQLWFDTAPLHHQATDPRDWQHARVTSVTRRDGQIRVDFDQFAATRPTTKKVAELIVQSWVQTVQDTLGSQDPVLFTVRGRPTWLYGHVDSRTAVSRHNSVLQKVFPGLDSPRDGDTVRSPLALIGVSGSSGVTYTVTDTRTGRTAAGRADRSADATFLTTLGLPAGNYQVAVRGTGFDGTAWNDEVYFTVAG